MKFGKLHLWIVNLSLLVNFNLYSQNRPDFYDPYDYDLRKYNSGANLDEYKDYELPPTYDKNPLVTPRFVQPPTNPFGSVPIFSLNSSANLNNLTNQANKTPTNTYSTDPLTGMLNKQDNQKKAAAEQRKKLKNIEPYTETQARRTQIIFFLTLPFGAAVMAGVTYFIGGVQGKNYFKTTPGALFILGGASAISWINVNLDRHRVEEWEKTHKVGFIKDEQNLTAQGIKNNQVQIFSFSKEF